MNTNLKYLIQEVMSDELSLNYKPGIRVSVRFVLFIALIFVAGQVATYAQEMHALNSSPAYTGGIQALKEFINNNLRYPDEARKSSISGVVEVKFMINTLGEVEKIMVLKGISPECDTEAVRLTGLLTGWSPGIRNGKPVNSFVCLPVEFKGSNQLQPTVITGKIIERTTGLPIEGIITIIKGTNIGSVSGPDGSYRIEIPSDARYLESFGVGYSIREVEIGFHSTITIELDPEYMTLEL